MYISRQQFFDSDDTAKWAGEAERQLTTFPPGAHYDNLMNPLFRAYLDNHKTLKESVEFGCGTALCRSLFKGLKYTGIDQNKPMLDGAVERWKKDKKVSIINAPLTSIPLLDKQFDVGLFCTVLQHNHCEATEEILAQAAKLIKPGGALFLLEATYIDRHYPADIRKRYKLPDIDPESIKSPDGHTLFTEKGWRHLLDRFGFTVVEYDGDCSYIAIRKLPNGLKEL